MAAPRTFARALTRIRPSSTPTPSPQSLRRFGSTNAGPTISPKALASSTTLRLSPRAIRTAPSISVRSFSSTPSTRHGHVDPPKPGEELWVTFIDKDGHEHKVAVSKGDNLLDIAQAHDLEMEGACGGSCACSTCHVIVENEDLYDKMPEPDDDENDMLDLAFGLTETSRLGCQVVMTPELDGLVVKLPSMTRNLQASDFK
ncbi:2Fe-2S ferredoxin-type domain-containing protein [Diaporthe sp. PMI_573]|nr:2Fe-2S ferredoxin-type domain-containing protein [Diaporthaceae sp. PMI_573]